MTTQVHAWSISIVAFTCKMSPVIQNTRGCPARFFSVLAGSSYCLDLNVWSMKIWSILQQDLPGCLQVNPPRCQSEHLHIQVGGLGTSGAAWDTVWNRPMYPPGEHLQQQVKYLIEKVTGSSAPCSKLVPCLQPVYCHTLADDCLFSPGQPKKLMVRVLSVCTQTQPSYPATWL